MDKKIKFNVIKLPNIIYSNSNILEINFDKGILINNFTIRSNKLFKFNLIINNNPIIDKEVILVSEHSALDGHFYYFNFNNDILIENIKYLGYNDNINIYFEYDNTNVFNSSDDILNKYLDKYVFTKKYFKFYKNDIFDIKLNNIMEHKLLIRKNRSEKKIEFNKIDENIYKFKYLKNNTFYVEFDEVQYIKNDYIYNFNNDNYISSYYPIL